MTDELTTYAILWQIKFNTIDEFEELWSTLMENDVDCLINRTHARSNFQSHVKIYFRTIKSRDTAMNLRALIK